MLSTTPFLGIPQQPEDYDAARIIVLPIPYEATVSYGRGTARGPQAVIDASAQVELFDHEIDRDASDIGIITFEALRVGGLVPDMLSKRIGSILAPLLDQGKVPLSIGGEHSITPAIVEHVHAAIPDITVVQLDAHADLRQEYEGERMSHACAMARVRDICPAVQVGIRSLSEEEYRWIERDRLPVFFADRMQDGDGWMDEAIAAIGTEKIYLSIDVDAFDASIMPATGTPEPGGMNWYQVTTFLKKLLARKRAVGIDLMELAPVPALHACDFLVAKLAYKCIGYYAQSLRE